MGESLEIRKICQGHTAQSFRQFEAYLEQNLFYTRNKYQYLQAITLPVIKNLDFLDTRITTFSFTIIVTK